MVTEPTELALSRCHRLGSPFVRGSFTGDGIIASQRSPSGSVTSSPTASSASLSRLRAEVWLRSWHERRSPDSPIPVHGRGLRTTPQPTRSLLGYTGRPPRYQGLVADGPAGRTFRRRPAPWIADQPPCPPHSGFPRGECGSTCRGPPTATRFRRGFAIRHQAGRSLARSGSPPSVCEQ